MLLMLVPEMYMVTSNMGGVEYNFTEVFQPCRDVTDYLSSYYDIGVQFRDEGCVPSLDSGKVIPK